MVGENRAQELVAKHDRYTDAFRWHFIGHLQSNKVKVVNELCELVHSVGSDSAARRVTIPALLEVNLAGEESKSGVPPEEIPGFLERYPLIRGFMTMPPLAVDPEASRPYFRRLRALADEHSLGELSMGTSQDYRIAAQEGATIVRVGSTIFDPIGANIPRSWGSATSGAARSSTSGSPRTRSGTTTTWRRASVSSRRVLGVVIVRTWAASEHRRRRHGLAVRGVCGDPGAVQRDRQSRLRSVTAPAPAKVHLVAPRAFNDAKQIADRFKAQVPVIINLQSADTDS